jgi:signal transduction histidine kinase
MRWWWARREGADSAHDTEVLEAIGRVGRLVSAELDLAKLVQAVTDAATQLSGAAFGAFFYNVVDGEGERYTLFALSGAPRSAFEHFPMPRNTAIFAPTFRGQGVVRLVDVTKDPRYGASEPFFGMPKGHLPVVSYLAVPVIASEGEVLGGLFFGHPSPGVFTERHEHIVVALAAHAAIAMQNARRYEEAERARRAAEAAERRSAFLADAAAILGGTLDAGGVMQRLTDLAVPRMGDWCAVFMRRPDDTVDCAAVQHRDPAKVAEARRYLASQPIDLGARRGVGKVLRTGEAELAADISEDEIRAVVRDEEGVRFRLAMGHGSILVVPVRIGGVVQGAIAFGRAERGAYDASDRVVAEDLAHRVALAIENAQLYQEAQHARARAERARWQAAFLAEASRVLASSLEYDATLDAVVRMTVPTLADWAVVHLLLRDGAVRRIGPAYAEPTLAPLAEAFRRTPTPAPGSIDASTAGIVWSGKPLLVSDVSREWLVRAIGDTAYLELVLQLDLRSLMMVPLIARGRTLGSMTLASLRGERRYGESDLAFVEEIGRRAGLAVDNARLYRQLEHAKAAAEDTNRAKDEFLAVLSHELRTPLNAVGGWIQILGEGTLQGPHAERAIETVQRNVSVLRRLIEDLLDVSAIVAGKLTLERSPCDLGAVVEQTVEMMAREGAARGVTLKADLEAGVVVEADAVRLRQIIGNLLSNALKFTPSGGVITVTLRRTARRASIVVADTGPGIPPEVLPHVFDRFRQADSTSTRPHGGLGLGLAIVKHLVELHGGSVRAENRPEGRGAAFTVELPTAT